MTDHVIPLIKLADVGKEYPLYSGPLRQMLGHFGLSSNTVQRKQALSRINLAINKGERVGIVGHNGSGKTTLLRLIIGHTKATCGTVHVGGHVQALMQTGYGFNDELTGLANIRNALIYNNITDADSAQTEQDIVDFIELGEFLHHPLKTYSLGMRARLEFAAATAIKPDVLAIDEVLGAGDGYFVSKCAQRMRSLIHNTTLLLVSHSLEQIREYCERVIWLDGGQIHADGPTAETLQQYRQYMHDNIERRLVNKSQHRATAITAIASVPTALIDKVRALFSLPQRTSCTKKFCFTDGSNGKMMEVGAALSLHLCMNVPAEHQPTVLGFSDQGAFVFEFKFVATTGVDEFDMTLHTPHLGVGVGNYVLFPALRRADGSIAQIDDQPLSLQMAQANWSDPPLLHLDGQWRVIETGATLASKISAWV